MQQSTFSDNYLTNYAGYTWDQDQPNRDTVGVWQNCIQVWIRNAAKFPNNVNETLANGNVDDAVCEESYYASYQMRGFACGKVAHTPESPINCKLFDVSKVFEVEKLESSSGLLVAFKAINSGNTCPIGDNPPTFGNSKNQGTASNQIANYTYDIDYSVGDTWQLSYTAIPVCPSGWTQFTRPSTNGCIQVIGGPDVTYTQSEALTNCENLGSTLTGLETIDERDFVANTGIALLGQDYPEYAGFWVSGTRKPECYTDGWEGYSYCTGTSLQQFDFTDGYLTNYAGFTWDWQQPDRNLNGPWANCIQIWIRNQAKFPQYYYTLFANGNADDAVCDVVDYQNYHLRGFACGKIPEVPMGAI
ncbi:hypothetical protein L3Y34_005944 [Caenorhabditis briggsae]|uniref:C-type lectin domain-containing protein n=1 Tax=Caenorhabditis briggsae TaxID=6238 RepID=A0AAE8ZSZ1_CAEBR|nr:hypothetical protein L3Y34_005944 [Caenorhabditis briggsae]